MKANLANILFVFFLFCFGVGNAQIDRGKDSLLISKSKDSLLLTENDTIARDSIKKPREAIDDIITHDAEDYTLQDAKNKTLTLFNNAEISYQDINLKAGKIVVNYKKNTVYAKGFIDSTGYVQRPVFKQGSQESEQDSILFNFKSEKALIYGVKTVQGEMIVLGDENKRVNDSTIYMRNLRFTTSDKKRPDYYIATDKAKLVPGKKIVVGASNLVLADVPTPVYLPFAYFPLTKGTTSGFIVPTWGENDNQGLFLQNGGYYFAINDYVDLELTGDLYSNGSWGLNTYSNYKVRYKFSGNFSLSYQNLIYNLRGFSDYSKSRIYNIRWSHRQDTKLSPNSNLSASVNLGSSTYFQESINELDQSNYLTNTFSSSISYSKNFTGTPFRMSSSMTHSQNSQTGVINMTLPTLQVSMDRQYPFAGKGGIKKNPIQKMGFNYNMNGQYKFTTTDEEFMTAKMFREGQRGLQHSTSTNTNIKAFKYFTVTPSFSYEDTWYFDRIEKYYDPTYENADETLGAAINDTISGFKRFGEYNVSSSLTTTLYGIFNFKKLGKLKSIRHTLTPSVSWGYRPNFAEKYELSVQTNSDGDYDTYTPFDNGIYGGPSSGISNSISLSLKNNLEAKLAPKEEDDEEEDRKITLLNNLNFSSSYNMAADSLKWSNVSVSAGTRIFQDKLNLNFSGSLDPYQVTENGVTIDEFNPKIFRLETASLSANFSLSSEDFKKDDNKGKKGEDSSIPPDVYGAKINPREQERDDKKTDTKEEKEAKLYHAEIPWNVSFVYSTSYNNNGYSTVGIQSHTVGFSGSLEPSPKWKIGFSSGYDFLEKDLSYTRLNFSRDLDSWKINFNWVPFGANTSYTFFIGVKSSLLSDLKWDKVKPADKVLY